MFMKVKNITCLFLYCTIILFTSCSKSSTGASAVTPPVVVPPVTPPVTGTNDVEFWLTNGDQSVLLKKQTGILSFTATANSFTNIEIDTTQKMQTVDGFGYTLTGGSATLINGLNSADKAGLLNELFGSAETSIGVSYLRISIGASDLSAATFTYDDMLAGLTDTTLTNFNLSVNDVDLILLLKQIIVINPNIKIVATPWSAPVWMKDNNSFTAGSLQPKYYNVYAQYFVKYLQEMKAQGITIDAITPQNEPLNANNTPSMVVTAVQEADFVRGSLGPALKAANLTTKIIVWDHNCDVPQYPTTILNDAGAAAFVDGAAFHLYAGDISALSTVHFSFPNKNIYFTEQYTASTGDFAGDLKWHLKNVVIGSMRNWSRNALEWNLANDAAFGPHTNGGCTTCKGALTINGSSIQRNVAYYIIAHAAKFVPGGSTRIGSNVSGDLQTVAFKTPSGKKILIAENDGPNSIVFNIKFNGKWVIASLPAGGVGTYIW